MASAGRTSVVELPALDDVDEPLVLPLPVAVLGVVVVVLVLPIWVVVLSRTCFFAASQHLLWFTVVEGVLVVVEV